ncbi:MAG: diguanylate cyclase [Lachnospiraceae bacterium]|nr:diguanylate cyclase [Lachnospiraceae bacterium]
MKTKFSLNRTQLKIIAIISMVIDHTAWGFVDFYSPLGQVMHVLGRFTIPIMCFFIAEGFRKTSDLKKYIYRMASFAAFTIIPFYLFFGEEYDYRQNIIFDLLLGLLVLTVLESKKLKTFPKVLLTILLFVVSATIGGWIITPILFILSFYYGKTFKQKAIMFIIADVATVLFLMISIYLNNIYHFSHYEWVWWDKSYLLGFMLALPLLYFYNGEKGSNFGGRYFFYFFYPSHFLALFFIKELFVKKPSPWGIYLGLHIICLAVVLVITFMTVRGTPSKGQSSLILVEFGAMIYTAGFILEIIADTAEGVHLACLVEYFGEYILFVAMLFFISVLCGKKVPLFVYVLCSSLSLIFLYILAFTRKTGYFYKEIGVDFSGPFSRPHLVYGIGFYFSIGYIFLLSVVAMVFCLISYRKGTAIEKKRLLYVLVAVLFCWLPYVIKLAGLTGGYEIPAIGIMLAAICMYICVYRMGFLDSVMIASTNALDHSFEGILVVDSKYCLQYQNKQISDIFGKLPANVSLLNDPDLGPVFKNEKATMKLNDKIYDFVQEPLMEKGYIQGHMLWVIDNTEHYRTAEQIHEMAIRDALTGLYNRNYFQELVEADLEEAIPGTMVMIDMDNFKQVNDKNGHQCGDAVLLMLSGILKDIPEKKLYCSRIGGDEFCAFIRNCEDESEIGELLTGIMNEFEKKLVNSGYGAITSLSIGAVPAGKVERASFKSLYSESDKILYKAKLAGKKRYIIK